MKILITLLITMNVLAGSQSRIANAVINKIKTVSSSHCALFPELEEECLADFKSKMKKKIKSLNSVLINEVFVKARKEETGRVKYEGLLSQESISFSEGSSAKSLRNLYKSTMKERNCVASHKSYLDSVAISYSPSDDCAILTPIVNEKQCVDNNRLYLTEAGVVYAPEDNCSELQALKDAHIESLP